MKCPICRRGETRPGSVTVPPRAEAFIRNAYPRKSDD